MQRVREVICNTVNFVEAAVVVRGVKGEKKDLWMMRFSPVQLTIHSRALLSCRTVRQLAGIIYIVPLLKVEGMGGEIWLSLASAGREGTPGLSRLGRCC